MARAYAGSGGTLYADDAAPFLLRGNSAFRAQLPQVLRLRDRLVATGLPVNRLVMGGTPTFPVWAKMELPGMQCSPGTFVLYDRGYGAKYAELSGFQPAALVVSRVVSKPPRRRRHLPETR